MNRTKLITIIIFLVLFIVAVYLTCDYLTNVASIALHKMKEEKVEQCIADVKSSDCHIYWIGEVPPYISSIGDKMTVVSVDDISEDTMPVLWTDVAYTIRDEEGNIVDSKIPRDYASNLVIVINGVSDIDEDKLDIINSCILQNHACVITIGESTVDMYRNYVNDFTLTDCNSMLFSMDFGNQEDYLESFNKYSSPSSVEDTQRGFAIAFFDAILSLNDLRSDYDETSTLVSTEASTSSEETSSTESGIESTVQTSY